MKIQGQSDVKVKVISEGKDKAEVIVSEQIGKGKWQHETRHLLRKGGCFQDKRGNKYL